MIQKLEVTYKRRLRVDLKQNVKNHKNSQELTQQRNRQIGTSTLCLHCQVIDGEGAISSQASWVSTLATFTIALNELHWLVRQLRRLTPITKIRFAVAFVNWLKIRIAL
jgi:hypothetical protein